MLWLAAVVAASHALGFALRNGSFWGADDYAGYAPWVLPSAAALLLGAAVAAARTPGERS